MKSNVPLVAFNSKPICFSSLTTFLSDQILATEIQAKTKLNI